MRVRFHTDKHAHSILGPIVTNENRKYAADQKFRQLGAKSNKAIGK